MLADRYGIFPQKTRKKTIKVGEYICSDVIHEFFLWQEWAGIQAGYARQMTMHALDLTNRSQGSRCFLGVFFFFRLFIYLFHIYIYIYILYLKAWRSDGDYVPCQVSPDNASEAMHSTCCSRRLSKCSHAFFFPPFPIQSIPAKPALLTCPAASEGAAPGGPEIDVSEVIKRNLERTRSQEGWSAVLYYMYVCYL